METNTKPGFIYVIKTQPCFLVDLPFYKIGQTQDITMRMPSYPLGSFLLFLQTVDDKISVEYILKRRLTADFHICKPLYHLGKEWFEKNDTINEEYFMKHIQEILRPYFKPSTKKEDEKTKVYINTTRRAYKNHIIIEYTLSDPTKWDIENVAKMIIKVSNNIDLTDIAYICYFLSKDKLIFTEDRVWFYKKRNTWLKYDSNSNVIQEYIHDIIKTLINGIIYHKNRKISLIEDDLQKTIEQRDVTDFYTKSRRFFDKIENKGGLTKIIYFLRFMLYKSDFQTPS